MNKEIIVAEKRLFPVVFFSRALCFDMHVRFIQPKSGDMTSLYINKRGAGRMSASSSSIIHARLETAVSAILVQLAYEQLQSVGGTALTISILIMYGCLQAAMRLATKGFQQQLLLRCRAVLIGLIGNVFLASVQISASSNSRLLASKLAVVGCVLVFLSITLHSVRGQYNLVGISLFVFSDSLKGQLESERDSLVVVVIAAVVCSASPLLTRALDAFVPGLSVLSSALFMATVNWLLDLIQDTSATPAGHSAMLLLLTVAIEVCKGLNPALDEPQGYAIYRVTAVLAAYLRRIRVEAGIVAVVALFALLATRKLGTRWALSGLAAQIFILVAVSAIVGEFKLAIAPLPVASKGIALAVLLVFFEAATVASAG